MPFTAQDLVNIGKNQSPQLWFNATLPVGANPGAATILATSKANFGMPAIGIQIVAKFRATVAVAAYTTINAETFQNLFSAIKFTGTRTVGGSVSPWTGSAATLFALNNMFKQGRGGVLQINGTRYPQLSTPLPLLSAPLAIATYDVIVKWYVPFAPFGVPNPLLEAIYAQRDSDWNRTFSVELDFPSFAGTSDPFGSKGVSGTIAFTAFGSSSGAGVVNVYTIPVLQAGRGWSLTSKFSSGFLQRNVVGGLSLATSGTNVVPWGAFVIL